MALRACLRDFITFGDSDEAGFLVHRFVHVIRLCIAAVTTGARDSLRVMHILLEQINCLAPDRLVARETFVFGASESNGENGKQDKSDQRQGGLFHRIHPTMVRIMI